MVRLESLRRLRDFLKIAPRFYASYSQCLDKNIAENSKTVKRYDVINWLIERTEQKRYLEIGVRNPEDCFKKINASVKYSVDPGIESTENLADFKFTSDEFFSRFSEGLLDIGTEAFDVIFIDGLHLADQAYRDILNSMQLLSSAGFIVVHDCNPPDHYFARENYHETSAAAGIWNGTTWKAIQRFRTENTNLCLVVDTDWGLGIIAKHLVEEVPLECDINPFYEFSIFEENRSRILNTVDFPAMQLRLSKR